MTTYTGVFLKKGILAGNTEKLRSPDVVVSFKCPNLLTLVRDKRWKTRQTVLPKVVDGRLALSSGTNTFQINAFNFFNIIVKHLLKTLYVSRCATWHSTGYT